MPTSHVAQLYLEGIVRGRVGKTELPQEHLTWLFCATGMFAGRNYCFERLTVPPKSIGIFVLADVFYCHTVARNQMNVVPWKEWVPGALNDRQLTQLMDEGFIENARGCSVDYSSFDLSLGEEVYEMVEGSVKPHGGGYERFLKTQKIFAKRKDWGPNGEMVLFPRKTYVFKLRERLSRTKMRGSPMHGQATAKSSVGRVDVLARLIVDGMHSYEEFDEKVWIHGSGLMFLEVTPMTFRVCVRPGISLSQLRLFYGKPDESEIDGKELYQAVLLGRNVDQFLRVDVSNIMIGGVETAAYRAKNENDNPVKLWTRGRSGKQIKKPNPNEYWDLVPSKGKKFRIRERSFYILRSKEKIILRRGVCVYCRAIDETIGEMRIHYAGFVHPYFGYQIKGSRILGLGTPLIFEVRGHDVDVVLNDEEPLARLKFYRMSQDCSEKPSRSKLSAYHNQTLKLSQFFDQFSDSN